MYYNVEMFWEVFMSLTVKQQANKQLIEGIIKKLEARNMEGYYFDTPAETMEFLADLIPASSSVAFGGSETLKETGILDFLKYSPFELFDRSTAHTPEEVREMYASHTMSDYFFMSSNAITHDGQLVNVDGLGNRVACLIHGPKNVIVVVGTNKICSSLEVAMDRVRNIAAPPNTVRLNSDTPCREYGKCMDCLSEDCICCHTVITRKSRQKGRIKVLFINDSFGY